MPTPRTAQTTRQSAIRELLDRGPIETQKALVDELSSRGLAATQSSVSRDLKELGAIKMTGGYELPNENHTGDAELATVASLIRSTRAAGGNLLVIKTDIGAAQRVALALDRSGWPEIVGNIGGDDTVFVATASKTGQAHLVSRIDRAIAGQVAVRRHV